MKVFVTTALQMTVPQTKQHFIDNNSSAVVVMLAYGAEKRPVIHYTCKRSARKDAF